MISVEHLAHRKALADAIDTAKSFGDDDEYERAEEALAWYDKTIAALAENVSPAQDGSDVASLRGEVEALQIAVKRLQSDQAVCSRRIDHAIDILQKMREHAANLNNAFWVWGKG